MPSKLLVEGNPKISDSLLSVVNCMGYIGTTLILLLFGDFSTSVLRAKLEYSDRSEKLSALGRRSVITTFLILGNV